MPRSTFHLILQGILLLLPALLFGQAKFDVDQLQDPEKNGPIVAPVFKQHLVYEYKPGRGKHLLYLKNGLRSATFINPEKWLAIKDSVVPYRIDIVYSRYPIREGAYHEIYPLLFERLIHLFNLDPALNDSDFSWNTILQTHCENDEQVNALFHGIVIWYRTQQEELELNRQGDSLDLKLPPAMQVRVQGTYSEFVKDIESIKNSGVVDDSLREELQNKSPDEQGKILKRHFEIAVAKKSSLKLTERTPQEMYLYKRQIEIFLKHNPFSDSAVIKVFDRHPDWADVAVVNDWTGSMYGYGAQVLYWHLLNYQNSPVRFLSLFNDGDRKMSNQKKIGETGGIYSAEASDIPQIINLFNLVRINGSGGDIQENDIEAILETQKRFPAAKEIVLIADNVACIRDIELASKIGVPVKIIVCGYAPEFGINPHLVYLAKITNGGLYTLEDEFENIKAELGPNGTLKSMKDRRFNLNILNCTPVDYYGASLKKEDMPVYTDLDTAIKEMVKVRKLDLHGKELGKLPPEILKMEHLFSLNIGDNGLLFVPGTLRRLKELTELDLSGNRIAKLPARFSEVRSLTYLNISNNQLQNINAYFESFFYLRVLDASNNQLADISNLNLLKNAISINLSNNQIAEVPAGINQLKRLKVLDLSNNRIETLPKTIIGLTRLEELNLENNQLEILPKFLYRLRKLKSLNLTGNNFSEEEKMRIRKELPQVQVLF